MGKPVRYKVARKKLFGLSKEALKELERIKADTGGTETQALHDALLGRDRFNPHVEAGIKAYQDEHNCSRQSAIEAMLSEAIHALRSSGRIPRQP